MKKIAGNNAVNTIVSALLLIVLAYTFLHSEFDLFSSCSDDHHQSHDFCLIVKSARINDTNAGQHISVPEMPLLNQFVGFYPASDASIISDPGNMRDLLIPPKPLIHMTNALLI